MEYVKLGRKLGIGTRVAAKILRDRVQNRPQYPAKTASSPAHAKPSVGEVQASARSQPSQTATPSTKPPARPSIKIDPRTATRNATRSVARGTRGFGRGFWNPFARATRALWHQVTGVFFAIFALFFAQSLWRVRGDWQSGPQHHRFAAYLIFMLVFAYFSITAFAHSRRSKS